MDRLFQNYRHKHVHLHETVAQLVLKIGYGMGDQLWGLPSWHHDSFLREVHRKILLDFHQNGQFTISQLNASTQGSSVLAFDVWQVWAVVSYPQAFIISCIFYWRLCKQTRNVSLNKVVNTG